MKIDVMENAPEADEAVATAPADSAVEPHDDLQDAYDLLNRTNGAVLAKAKALARQQNGRVSDADLDGIVADELDRSDWRSVGRTARSGWRPPSPFDTSGGEAVAPVDQADESPDQGDPAAGPVVDRSSPGPAAGSTEGPAAGPDDGGAPTVTGPPIPRNRTGKVGHPAPSQPVHSRPPVRAAHLPPPQGDGTPGAANPVVKPSPAIRSPAGKAADPSLGSSSRWQGVLKVAKEAALDAIDPLHARDLLKGFKPPIGIDLNPFDDHADPGLRRQPGDKAAVPARGAGAPAPGPAAAQAGPAFNEANLLLPHNEDYREPILKVARIVGRPPQFIAAVMSAEAWPEHDGHWRANSRSSSTRAAGVTQFEPATWGQVAFKKNGFLNARLRQMGVIDGHNRLVWRQTDFQNLRNQPELAILAAAEYAEDNLAHLKREGLVDDNMDPALLAKVIYLAHHEGPGGAASILRGGLSNVSEETWKKNVTDPKERRKQVALHGDWQHAYLAWFKGYIDNRIDVTRFMRDRRGVQVPSIEQAIRRRN